MAVAIARSVLFSCFSRPSLYLAKNLLFSSFSSYSSSIARTPTLAGFVRAMRSSVLLSHSVRVIAPGASHLNPIRCGRSAYSMLNSGPPTEMDDPLFPGCDYKHWLVIMDRFEIVDRIVDRIGGMRVTEQHLIDYYIETLAKVVGSKEEAKEKIYNNAIYNYLGYGCNVDEETAKKLEGLPGVLLVLPDAYIDPKDYKD